jgi:hypothetical protein
MFSRSLVPVACLCALAAAASPAGAQSAYCMPDAPPAACFTLELFVAEAGPGAPLGLGGPLPTFMTFRVRNLQGSINSDPSLFGINFFGISRTFTPPPPEPDLAPDFLVMPGLALLTSADGPVEWNPEPLAPFNSVSGADPNQRGFLSDGTGIGGCASTATPFFPGTVARTCAVQGLTGAIDVSFYVGIFDPINSMMRAVTLDDVSISIGGTIGGDQFGCRFSGAESGRPAGTTCLSVPYTAVPEPGTLALLAAPAIGLIRRRRRRR